MSSKHLSQAWDFKADTAEEKLILLAFGELANRNGEVNTSMLDVCQMTGLTEKEISNLTSKLMINGVIHNTSRSEAVGRVGHVQCTLSLVKEEAPKFRDTAIDVNELSPNVIPDWATTILFKTGFGSGENVWVQFIARMRKKGRNYPRFSLVEIKRELHQFVFTDDAVLNHHKCDTTNQLSDPNKRTTHQEFSERVKQLMQKVK